MSDEPPRYTGHDFAELMTTELARAESIALMLRSRGIDARAVEAGGWTIGGPSDTASVLVPRPWLDEARAHVASEINPATPADANDTGPGRAPDRCPCGYSLEGLGTVNLCPECGFWFARSPEGERVVSLNLAAKRERMRPVALGLAIILIVVLVIGVVLRPRVMWNLSGFLPW